MTECNIPMSLIRYITWLFVGHYLHRIKLRINLSWYEPINLLFLHHVCYVWFPCATNIIICLIRLDLHLKSSESTSWKSNGEIIFVLFFWPVSTVFFDPIFEISCSSIIWTKYDFFNDKPVDQTWRVYRIFVQRSMAVPWASIADLVLNLQAVGLFLSYFRHFWTNNGFSGSFHSTIMAISLITSSNLTFWHVHHRFLIISNGDIR